MDEHKMIARANGKSTIEALHSMIEMIIKEFNRMINACPNKRVVWLMKHGKNRRIRNKNAKRILKYYKKTIKEKK